MRTRSREVTGPVALPAVPPVEEVIRAAGIANRLHEVVFSGAFEDDDLFAKSRSGDIHRITIKRDHGRIEADGLAEVTIAVVEPALAIRR